MAIDLETLHKLESLPASAQAEPVAGDQRLVVLVKLRPEGEADENVESVAISRRLPLVG